MHNQPELKAVSVRLYKYLCDEIVGCEKVVRYKRLYCKLHDDISNESDLEIISSGSTAEGLTLTGSDIDIMFRSKFCEVYEDEPRDEEDVIILDTENALPGFALLKVPDGSDFPTTNTANGILLANTEMFQDIWDQEEGFDDFFEIHGPSMSNSMLHDIDIVPFVRCHTWPKVAHKWFFRYRPSSWPSQDTISKVASDGVLLVPVGSKSPSSELQGNPLEWRFSFSLSEKLLIYSFNHTQLLCYSLLKLFLKEIVNIDNILNNRLCSYHMKTVLFWILEEDENLLWIPEHLLHCFLLCIQRLHYWIVCGYIPNYFIPEYNMVEGKLSQDIRSYLALFLDKINMHGDWKIIFSAPSLCNFRNTPLNISRQFQRLAAIDEAVLSLRTFSTLAFCFSDYYTGETLCVCILYRMLRKHLPNSARKMLAVMFLKGNKMILTSMDVLNGKNKCSYLHYKECLSRVLINTFYDDVFGWLLLAAYFYSTQEFDKMSQILLFASSELSLNKHRFSGASHVDNRGFEFKNYQFLNADFPDIAFLGSNQSLALFFFLNFLYSRKQGSCLETQSALKLLEQTVNEKSDTPIHWLCTLSSYKLLQKAFELLNDIEGKEACTLETLKAVKKSEKFNIFVKCDKDVEEMKLILELV
ncbi:uncharacterized protein LOC127718416 [Mytilus californianus]|uniref:uncharacterized protein LOC127718416 n=1 Tax=Mytilus californianus TaxID=6549 RepID=UPI0022475640|nr:uncharacterized protein LOC127718416 [Mytilus californianus]